MKKTTVLIVEDDRAFIQSMVAVVTSRGFIGMEASTVEEALGFLQKKNKRVVVVTDINLNGESGLELLSRVGMSYPHVPVIIITGYASFESSLRALRLGAYDYISKPFEPEVLLHSVRRAYEKVQAYEEKKRGERKLKRMVKELEKKNREIEKLSLFKSFMMSMAGHDLKTLLTVLNGYYKVLSDNFKGTCSNEMGNMIDEGDKCLKRGIMMLESILDYHSVEMGTIHVENRKFSLEDVIDECIDFLNAYCEMKEIHLKKVIPQEDLVIYGDRLKIAQILDNLVTNSIKFTSKGGEISISVDERRDSDIKVTVRDNGCGIPQENIRGILGKDPQIFQRDGTGRVGLGLSICKRLIEVQKGTMNIKSKPGKGTEISFTLPVENTQ